MLQDAQKLGRAVNVESNPGNRTRLSAMGFVFLAACSAIPNEGPSAEDVANQAGTAALPRYEIVDIDSSIIDLPAPPGA